MKNSNQASTKNRMVRVWCNGASTLANSTAMKDEFRCTKCGQTGHALVKDGSK